MNGRNFAERLASSPGAGIFTGCSGLRMLSSALSFRKKGANPLSTAASRVPATRNATIDEIRSVAEALGKVLEDDKAEDLVMVELQGRSSLADFMLIASGRSGRHVAALADHVAQEVKKLTGRTPSVEGMPNADWVLIDTGDVIVHLFRPEVREFYNLEKIWAQDTAGRRASAN
ncbi:ribosome silencing factor [Hyphomonas sp.]|uniref:ribosome silencing factor n=1 Tax=Hyphomonas sp. TaxID=87 RepID=UPI00391CF675